MELRASTMRSKQAAASLLNLRWERRVRKLYSVWSISSPIGLREDQAWPGSVVAFV